MFGFSFDRRTLTIIIAILAIFAISDILSQPGGIISLLYSVPGLLIAITFHEFAHGFVAYKLGDDTAKNEGRLSLNPLAHLDPIGTLMLITLKFGWGKPVHVNPSNYTRKMSMEKGEALVSAAGPIMNFIIALIFTLIYCAIYKFAPTGFMMSTIGTAIIMIITSTILTNIGLGVFNLIPLPPLDGSKIIKPILPYKAKEWFENNTYIFYVIFIILFVTRILSNVISPAMEEVTKLFISFGYWIFGL